MSKQQQGGGGQQQGGDNSLDFLWLIALIVVTLVSIWYFFQAQISAGVLYVRYYEILAVREFLTWWVDVTARFGLPEPNMQLLNQWVAYIKSGPAELSLNALINVSTVVGNYLRYPIMVLLGTLAVTVFFRNVGARFRMTYNMTTLKKSELQNWPQIMPIANLDLVNTPLDKAPWAMSLPPMKFCKHYKLIREDMKEGKPIAILELDKTGRVMALQLGNLWPGIQHAPKHVQALFAIFAAKANHDGDTARKLVREIAGSTVGGKKPSFKGIRLPLIKYHNTKIVQRVVQRHAYTYTVMATLLELARTDGVLATSEYIWLKPLDRKLWYMLNSVGRQGAVPEIGGAFAHWLAEKQMGRPLKVPMVDQAVSALKIALDEIVYDPEEEQ